MTLTPLTAGATSPALPALPTPVATGDGQGTPLVPEPGRLHLVLPRPMQDPALATKDGECIECATHYFCIKHRPGGELR